MASTGRKAAAAAAAAAAMSDGPTGFMARVGSIPRMVRDVATVQPGTTPGQIDRSSMQRYLSIVANVEGDDLGRAARRRHQALAAAGPPPRGVRVQVRGQVAPMEEMFRSLLTRTFARLLPVVAPNAAIVIVVGDTRRGGRRTDAAKVVKDVFAAEAFETLRLEKEFRDIIPDIRRSRRDLAGTKRETVLVFRLHAQVDRNAKAAS